MIEISGGENVWQIQFFFELKLKRGRKSSEVFEKMAKSVKKKGATKKWTYIIDKEKEVFTVNFGDGESEDFVLYFEKQIADSFCKVNFPLEGELFEDEKKSEFKALLNMIYSARTSFSLMKISDDYGLAQDFMKSKEYKLKLKELDADGLGYKEYAANTRHAPYSLYCITQDKAKQ